MQELQQNPPASTPDTERPAAGVSVQIPASQPIVTYVLLAILIIVFVAQLVENQISDVGNPLVEAGIFSFDRILNGEYYRLFTSMFLHASVAHIFLNGIALWSFGRSVEGFFGHTRFTLIYFLGGLFGGILEFIFSRGLALGASGAIFAIFGAEMVFLYRNRTLFGKRADQQLRSLIILALVNLGFGIYTQFAPGSVRIGIASHMGGFIAGAALAWFIAPRFELRADASVPPTYHIADTITESTTWLASGVVAVVILAIFLVSLTILRTAA
ncbi:MAG: rhomboid family intramembrane serine protease [Chloroflexota bacterium]